MDLLGELLMTQWNRVGARLEPVGTVVRVLTDDCEIYIAYRDKQAVSYNEPVYIHKETGKIIENARYWSYG